MLGVYLMVGGQVLVVMGFFLNSFRIGVKPACPAILGFWLCRFHVKPDDPFYFNVV
jgi:hypothetical protein